MTLVSPFSAPKLKAEWGLRRAHELSKELKAFEATKPYKAVRTATGATTVEYVGRFPNEISLILGDAAHNLRTALDLLACDLVSLNGKSPKNVYFPFSESADQLDHMIERRKFNRASPEAIELLTEMKPFKGGNLMLRALHDLDIMDKHQLIIPVGHGNIVNTVPNAQLPVTMRNVSMNGVSIGGVKPSDLQVELGVFFGPNAPDPLPGRPILKTLEEFAHLVFGIIQSFETLVGRSGKHDIGATGEHYRFSL